MPRRKKVAPRKRIELRHFKDEAGRDIFDQQSIFYWGVLCGYCGDKPGMAICWLAGSMDRLTEEQKQSVVDYVGRHVGEVRETYQTKRFLHVRKR
jgi:hypothetical protein